MGWHGLVHCKMAIIVGVDLKTAPAFHYGDFFSLERDPSQFEARVNAQQRSFVNNVEELVVDVTSPIYRRLHGNG